MKTKFNKEGYLEELIIDNQNIILPWGIEASDSAGFFSSNEKSQRTRIIYKEFNSNKNEIKGELEVKLPFSHWKLKINEKKVSKNKIIRQNGLRCLDKCQFNDFVSRFRFKKKYIKYVKINERRFTHKNQNIYHQFKASKVYLYLTFGGKICVELKKFSTIGELKPLIYARDYKNEWIVHVRLFPIKPKIKQVRICREWYNKAIPAKLAKPILMIKPLRNFLWYRGERKGGFPIGAYGLVLGKKGDVLDLQTEIKYFPQ